MGLDKQAALVLRRFLLAGEKPCSEQPTPSPSGIQTYTASPLFTAQRKHDKVIKPSVPRTFLELGEAGLCGRERW